MIDETIQLILSLSEEQNVEEDSYQCEKHTVDSTHCNILSYRRSYLCTTDNRTALAYIWMHCKFDTPVSHNLMQGKKYKFMSMYKTTFTIAAVAAVVFIGSFVVRGLSKSIDFTGGRNYVVQFEKAVEPEQIRTVLGDAFVNADGTKANTSAIAIGTDGFLKASTFC